MILTSSLCHQTCLLCTVVANFYQLGHTLLSNQPNNNSKYLFNKNFTLEQFPLSPSQTLHLPLTQNVYIWTDNLELPAFYFDSLINLILLHGFTPKNMPLVSHEDYIRCEWCRWWWLQAPRGCHTIPQTQGLGEWPNSGWYCSLGSAGPIQLLFRQDEMCPGHPPGEELVLGMLPS